jgi:hypothetical protein
MHLPEASQFFTGDARSLRARAAAGIAALPLGLRRTDGRGGQQGDKTERQPKSE